MSSTISLMPVCQAMKAACILEQSLHQVKSTVVMTLVMGRSRVAPTKVTAIPSLELSAAVVAVWTSDMLKKELEIECQQEFFWTDSRVVLGYIKNKARIFHVFVANRVEHIKISTKAEQWRYVASEENPADHASRGVTAE